jgi:uncharacterized protein (TIGR02118 family)
MRSVKLIVMYPPPNDVAEFERRYRAEHVPMAIEKLAGRTKIVDTRVLASPQGTPGFHRIAEVHFATLEALQQCAASSRGKETLSHAVAISSGGTPVVLVAEEETFSGF